MFRSWRRLLLLPCESRWKERRGVESLASLDGGLENFGCFISHRADRNIVLHTSIYLNLFPNLLVDGRRTQAYPRFPPFACTQDTPSDRLSSCYRSTTLETPANRHRSPLVLLPALPKPQSDIPPNARDMQHTDLCVQTQACRTFYDSNGGR